MVKAVLSIDSVFSKRKGGVHKYCDVFLQPVRRWIQGAFTTKVFARFQHSHTLRIYWPAAASRI